MDHILRILYLPTQHIALTAHGITYFGFRVLCFRLALALAMGQTPKHKLRRQNRPKARAAAIATGATGNVAWVMTWEAFLSLFFLS